MSPTEEGKPFRFIPKTTVGKALLALYLIAFVAIALSVMGVVFNEPRMRGPMPEVALWVYSWLGVINLVLLGTYVFLFKPWAEAAERYVDAESAAWAEEQSQEMRSRDESVLASTGDK